MRIVSNQKQVLKVLKEYRESVLLQYGNEKKVISRIIGARIADNNKDIIIDVTPLKATYKVKKHTFISGVKAIGHHKNQPIELSVSFFRYR